MEGSKALVLVVERSEGTSRVALIYKEHSGWRGGRPGFLQEGWQDQASYSSEMAIQPIGSFLESATAFTHYTSRD